VAHDGDGGFADAVFDAMQQPELTLAGSVMHLDSEQNTVRINRMAKDDGLDCLDLL